jgi:hypothetical protein
MFATLMLEAEHSYYEFLPVTHSRGVQVDAALKPGYPVLKAVMGRQCRVPYFT